VLYVFHDEKKVKLASSFVKKVFGNASTFLLSSFWYLLAWQEHFASCLIFLTSCHGVKSAQTSVISMQAMSEEEALAMQAKLEKDGEAPLTICTTNQVIIILFQLSSPAFCHKTLPFVSLL
jgi:hypothetical protein